LTKLEQLDAPDGATARPFPGSGINAPAMPTARARVTLEQEEREVLKKAAAIIARRGEQASDYLAKAKAKGKIHRVDPKFAS
jgi:hypothetical protein